MKILSLLALFLGIGNAQDTTLTLAQAEALVTNGYEAAKTAEKVISGYDNGSLKEKSIFDRDWNIKMIIK